MLQIADVRSSGRETREDFSMCAGKVKTFCMCNCSSDVDGRRTEIRPLSDVSRY
jgi:hypothetical protein